jgi:hypothetical protein
VAVQDTSHNATSYRYAEFSRTEQKSDDRTILSPPSKMYMSLSNLGDIINDKAES